MALYQTDWFKRVPYVPNPDGWYYWSSVYYWNADNPTEYGNNQFHTSQVEEQITTESVQRWYRVMKSPPGRANVVEEGYNWIGQGGLILDPDGYSMLNTSRWYFRSDTGRLSWRLNRQPLRPTDIEGSSLSASGLAQQEVGIAYMLGFGIFTNSYGELLVEGWPSPKVHQWQLRNGTHRRARVYD